MELVAKYGQKLFLLWHFERNLCSNPLLHVLHLVPNSLLYLFFTFKPENICRAPICALHRVEQWRKLGAKRIGTLAHYCSQRDPAFKMKLAPISISLFITFAHTFTFLLFMFENRGICSKRPLKKKLALISLSLSLYCFFCRCFFSYIFFSIRYATLKQIFRVKYRIGWLYSDYSVYSVYSIYSVYSVLHLKFHFHF